MADSKKNIPRSLTSKAPSWPLRTWNALAPKFLRIEPEVYSQTQGIQFNRFGLTKSVGGQFGEISGGNQFVIERPSGGHHIDAAKALANNKGFVYASVNAIAREVMNIDWRLFEVNGRRPRRTDRARSA